MQRFLTGFLSLLCLSFLAPVVAGQLEPPPGPIMPTDRVTLNGQEVFPPFTIDRSGSYVLTSDILDCIGCDDLPTSGIIIDADDVTLDLNGFAVVGDPENSQSAIVVTTNRKNVVIRNGVVRDWSGSGIDDRSIHGAQVEHLRAAENGAHGIVVGGNGMVRHSIAQANGLNGIVVGPGSVVDHCTASDNAGDGIVAQPTAVPSGSTISHCGSRGNGGIGILVGDGTTVVDCAVSLNTSHGISSGLGCSIRGNSVVTNGGHGIQTFGSLVSGNSVGFNALSEIDATNSTVVDNHVVP